MLDRPLLSYLVWDIHPYMHTYIHTFLCTSLVLLLIDIGRTGKSEGGEGKEEMGERIEGAREGGRDNYKWPYV